MNKFISSFIIILGVTTLVLIAVSCRKNKDCNVMDLDEDLKKTDITYYEKYGANDTILLKEGLTKEYDIDELMAFFEKGQSNVNTGFEGRIETLYFDDVNRIFPVEIMRTNGYTVYKVKQGGYYYVFWEETYDAKTYEPLAPDVYYAAYIFSEQKKDVFEDLEIGTSTAQDVKKMDPYLELNFLMSNGIYSFSFLNEDELIQIKYVDSPKISNYEDLKIESINVISREAKPSRLSTILTMDLPIT